MDITNPLSLNLYSYVENNPLKYIDPTGHESEYSAYIAAREKIEESRSLCDNEVCTNVLNLFDKHLDEQLGVRRILYDVLYEVKNLGISIANILLLDELRTLSNLNSPTEDYALALRLWFHLVRQGN